MAIVRQSSKQVSRNRFMVMAMGGIGTVIGAFYVGSLLRYLYPSSATATPPLSVKLRPDGVLTPGSDGQLTQFIPFEKGITKEAFYYPTVKDKSVVVGVFVMKKDPNGPLVAQNIAVIEQTCTHLGCPVMWRADDNKFECPCHGSQFNRKGDRVSGPANDPLYEHKFTLAADNTLTITGRKS